MPKSEKGAEQFLSWQSLSPCPENNLGNQTLDVPAAPEITLTGWGGKILHRGCGELPVLIYTLNVEKHLSKIMLKQVIPVLRILGKILKDAFFTKVWDLGKWYIKEIKCVRRSVYYVQHDAY